MKKQSSKSKNTEREEEFGLPDKDYAPIEKSTSNIRLLGFLFIVMTCLSIGLVYFFYCKPSQQKRGLPKTDSGSSQVDDSFEDSDLFAEDSINEKEKESDQTDRSSSLKEEVKEEVVKQKKPTINIDEAHSVTGEVKTLYIKKGFYYVIAGSFVDIDLAKDFAKKLVKDGTTVTILIPSKGKLYHHVAVAETETLQEAKSLIIDLKEKYGEKIWPYKH